MPSLAKRDDSSFLYFRQRVPQHVLPMVRGRVVVIEFPALKTDAPAIVACTLRDFARFSLKTRDSEVAKARQGLATAHLERVYSAAVHGATQLSHKQKVGLSGEVYHLWTSRFEDNPGTPDHWAAFKAFNRAIKEGRIASATPIRVDGDLPQEAEAAQNQFGPDLTAGINALGCGAPNGLEERFGRLLDWVLTVKGLQVDFATRGDLLFHVASAVQDAAWHLKRNAAGDYTPDPKATRFPVFRNQPTITLSDLFDRWQRETSPAGSTVSTWKGVVRSFRDHLGQDDAHRITADDVVAWKDRLVVQGLSRKTINDSYLAALKALLNYGVANKLLPGNPAEGVRAAGRKRAGEKPLPYTDDEVARLLTLSEQEEQAARRWLPWLAALSGARIGELAQLWGVRVNTENGVTFMHLAPAEDGGSLKNEGSERKVPLHPALVEAGFLVFVRSRGDGPLFYRKSSGKSSKRHASKGVTNRLAKWIRQQGFNDPRKSPNHALRHWWKTKAGDVGIQDRTADAIQGHRRKSDVAARYDHAGLKRLAEAIECIQMPKTGQERTVDSSHGEASHAAT